MDLFPRAFLLVFCQFAVGGLFCLAIPPFHDIERGYYKSSAFVFVLLAVLALIGRVALWWEHGSAAPGELVELGLWAVFVACSGGYLASLWGENVVWRARLFSASWVVGVVALIAFAESYRQAPLLSLETLLFPISFLLSALVLGGAISGMLLGHWYLIDQDLSLRPLEQVLAVYRGSLWAQLGLTALLLASLALVGDAASRAAVARVLADHLPLLTARLVVSPLGAGLLAWMIGRTLRIPQTMAATGLFYIAVLAVLVGELMGRFLLFRSGLPL